VGCNRAAAKVAAAFGVWTVAAAANTLARYVYRSMSLVDKRLLHPFRRLRLRYEKRADMYKAFLSLACGLICWKFLQGHFP
jgi:hypothetical protein